MWYLSKTTKLNSFKLLFCISFFVCFVCNRKFNVLWLDCSFTIYLLYFEVKECNKCIVVKTAFCLIITLLSWLLVIENKHLSRDPQLSSVTRNCQIYNMQLDTLKTGSFKLKELINFIIVIYKEEYFVEQFMPFHFSKLSFQRDTLR